MRRFYESSYAGARVSLAWRMIQQVCDQLEAHRVASGQYKCTVHMTYFRVSSHRRLPSFKLIALITDYRLDKTSLFECSHLTKLGSNMSYHTIYYTIYYTTYNTIILSAILPAILLSILLVLPIILPLILRDLPCPYYLPPISLSLSLFSSARRLQGSNQSLVI